MEDTATAVDTGAELDSQPTETESTSPETGTAQADKPASKPDLKKLLEREKSDPNVKFTDAELDVLDEHYESDSKPKTKPTPKAEEPEDDEADDEPAAKPKEKPEEEDKPDPEPEDEDDSDDAKALTKEVGAKNLREALTKVKELRSKLGGKDAQAVARLTKEKDEIVQGGKSLWEALGKGDPQAMAFAEKQFGVKFAGSQPKAESKVQPLQDGEAYIDPDQFIDPDSAKLVNSAFQRQAAEIKALKEKFGVIEEERDRHVQDTVHKSSVMKVIDEMSQVRERIPALKNITGFREAAEAVLNGNPDPRLDVFQELFEIAAELGPKGTLLHAFDIKRGRDSDRIEATAKEAGRKEAYNQKPNPSLSGATGGRGEQAYQPVTEAQLEKWESDHTSHPDHWYDKDENPIQSKIPKRAWKLFDFK